MKKRVILVSSILFLTAFVFATAEPAMAIEVKIGVGPAGVIGYMPTYVGQGLGYFKELEKKDIKVIFVNFKGGTPTALALLGKDIEFANMVLTHVVKSKAKGKDLKFLLTFFNAQVMAMIARTADKDVTSPKDLVGKRIGITRLGSATHMQARHILLHYGVDPNSVEYLPVGAGGCVVAWNKKTIDALVHLDPWISDLVDSGSARILYDVRSVANTVKLYGSEHPSSGLITRPDYISSHPEVVQEIVNVYAKTLKWIHSHTPEEVAQVVSKELGWKVSYVRNNISGLSKDGAIVDEGVGTVIKYLKKDKLLSQDFDYPYSVFYDDSFIKKAVKSF
ncbi:MAG: ABC transporter substrate-binding protein [Desulfobacteraceae bacterium]|jgi:NitT/TauT family transport system substrate-binding protein